MLPALRLAPVALLTTSCGLVLDFNPDAGSVDGGGGEAPTAVTTSSASGGLGGSGGEPPSGSTGTGGDGGGTGGSGAGGGAPGPAVAILASSTPGGTVEVQSVAVDGDTTWVAGWFSGASLLHGGDATSTTPVLPGGPTGATTFVLGLDPDGVVQAAFPLARSRSAVGFDGWLGARVAVHDGALYVSTSIEDGAALLEGVDVAAPNGATTLLVARIDPLSSGAAASALWAQRCDASQTMADAPTERRSVSGRRGGLVALPGGDLAIAATLDAADTFTCTTSIGGAACAPITFAAREGGVVWRVAGASGACAGTPTRVEPAAGGVVYVEDLAAADDAVLVSGHAFTVDTLLPWGVAFDPDAPSAFIARLAPGVTPAAGDVRSFRSTGHPAHGAPDGSLVGATPSGVSEGESAGGADVRILHADGEAVVFGDVTDGTRIEVATDVEMMDGAVLVTGFMTEDGSLASDLCGATCAGDLVEADPCGTPAPGDVDAFWLFLPGGEDGAQSAVGRAFGGCGRQVVTGGAVTDEAIVVVTSVQGVATLDLLDASTTVTAAPGNRDAVVARVPRDALAARSAVSSP